MATIKSFTDLSQSKVLADILPLESADGFWEYHDKWYSEGDEWEGYEDYPRAEPYLEYTREDNEWKKDKSDIPCWSLAALLNLLPCKVEDDKNHIARLSIFKKEGNQISLSYCSVSYDYEDLITDTYDNFVDACVDIIIKLKERNLI